jgi:prepilin-type N-terminal cleavage/methylation domain-containing protein
MKITNDNQGFSLVEVLVSVFIVTVALLAIIKIFPFGMQINKASENLTVANGLAQSKIEQLTSMAYDDLNVGTIEPRTHVPDSNSIYERQSVINYLNSNLQTTTTDQGLKKITVTIYWPSAIQGAESKTFTLTTIISQH